DSNSPQDFSLAIEPGLPANQPPTLTIQSPTDGETFQAASAVTFAWTMSDDIFANADLLVWANVTIGNVTTPLLEPAAGATPAVNASAKAAHRCHTIVRGEEVACFFCGYSFTEGKPSP